MTLISPPRFRHGGAWKIIFSNGNPLPLHCGDDASISSGPVDRARHRRYSRRPANGRKRSGKAWTMKIVAFEGQGGARLGVVEGDQAIDLQVVDSNAPTDLGEWLAKNNGDVKPLAELAKRAPATARKPLASLTYRLPVGRPGKII